MTRRKFLSDLAITACLSYGASGSGFARAAISRPLTTYSSGAAAYPFSLGVASGPGNTGGLVLWTRLLPEGWTTGEHMTAARVPVRWEVAADEAFRRVVLQGTAQACLALGHSVHVEVDGLPPDQSFFYRFQVADAISPVGRVRTLPDPKAPLTRWRLAFASCQHYEHGYFGAYQAMRDDAPDAVLFLGDYIYESGAHAQRFRPHPTPAAFDLASYRARYALYRSDAALQAMHAACPWLVIWDDHEVINDYAGSLGGAPYRDFLARRQAAYQAWYEHMPVPASTAAQGYAHLQIYRTVHYGNLASIYLLDGRQFRDPHACGGTWRGGSLIDAQACAALFDKQRSLLGQQQEDWLKKRLAQATRRWNIIAQPTLFTPLAAPDPTRQRIWNDGWEGYPEARQRLVNSLRQPQVTNPLIVGGDVHANWVCEVPADGEDPTQGIVASEFCGTSISAPGMSAGRAQAIAAVNPQVRFVDSDTRGYGLLTLTPDAAHVKLRGIDSPRHAAPRVQTLAEFQIVSGQPKIQVL